MKVLLISNQHPNQDGIGNPIMYRMQNALRFDERIDNVDFFPFCNTIGTFSKVRKAAKSFDIIHIHFGGLYALMIWCTLLGVKCKKFITFHGTDIHAKALKTSKSIKSKLKIWLNQKASFLSIRLFDKCGFVASEMMGYVPKRLDRQMKKKAFLHSLGVDYSAFTIMDKEDVKAKLSMNTNKKYVLFSDISNTNIKRRDLAEAIIKELAPEYELCIMCGVKPNQVPLYINACEFLLLTSDEEGSPNIIRECLALNKPVFSVDVGDASKQLYGLSNSCIISREPIKASKTILDYMNKSYIDNTREARKAILDFQEITKKIVSEIYCSL